MGNGYIYPMGITIPGHTQRNWLIVNQLHAGGTGKIIWDGYIILMLPIRDSENGCTNNRTYVFGEFGVKI